MPGRANELWDLIRAEGDTQDEDWEWSTTEHATTHGRDDLDTYSKQDVGESF